MRTRRRPRCRWTVNNGGGEDWAAYRDVAKYADEHTQPRPEAFRPLAVGETDTKYHARIEHKLTFPLVGVGVHDGRRLPNALEHAGEEDVILQEHQYMFGKERRTYRHEHPPGKTVHVVPRRNHGGVRQVQQEPDE